jgi:hypothetical protein
MATRALHEQFPITVQFPTITKFSENVPAYADHEPEMAKMYKQMAKTKKKPSIQERLTACNAFGYSSDMLLLIHEKDEKRKADAHKLDTFCEMIFGEFSEKKQSAPKKKSLYQILKIKKPSYALPDAVDVEDEEPNEDAEPEPEVEI